MQYTLGNILSRLGKTNYQRGLDYFIGNKVLAVVRNGDFIDGKVLGSHHQIYTQSVGVHVSKIGHVLFDGDCSCPVGYNCKHVVAVLIAHLKSDVDDHAEQMPIVVRGHAPALNVPAQVMDWIDRVDRALEMPETTRVKVKHAAYHLIFVLSPSPYTQTAALGLSVYKARLRADGEIAAADVVYDFQRLVTHPPAYATANDEQVIRMILAMRSGGYHYGNNTELSGKLGAHILRQLLDENRLYRARTAAELAKGKLTLLQPGGVRQIDLIWQPLKNTLRLKWQLRCDAIAPDASSAEATAGDTAMTAIAPITHDPVATIFSTEPPMYADAQCCGDAAYAAANAVLPLTQLQELVLHAPVVNADNKEAVARMLLSRGLADVVPLPHELPETIRHDVVPTPVLVLDCLPLDGNAVDIACVSFDYEGRRCEIVTEIASKFANEFADVPVLMRHTESGIEKIVRNMAAETQAFAALRELGFVLPDNDYLEIAMPGALTLPAPSDWLQFHKEQLPQLIAQGWKIDQQPGYRYDITEVDDWYAEIGDAGDQPGNPWFDLELGVIVNGERISLLPVLVDLIRNAPHDFNPQALAARGDDDVVLTSLPNGLRVVLPWGRIKPILATLGELYFTEKSGNSMRLPALDAARLAELEGVTQLRWLGGQRVRALGKKISEFSGIAPITLPQGLQATLRPYQIEGVAWLQFLREFDLAGILADDMGLGKTVQALTHILIEKESGRMTQPVLVVAPTSLMGNWQDEAARFAPSLRVLILQGKERLALFDQIDQFDIVLTTYALLPRDEEKLRKHDYHIVILDEAHYIKNARAKATQVAGLLKARHRLCMTGTPLENHLGELWSQFHFLMPGLLGEDKAFNRDFRAPIEKLGDDQRRRLLMRRLKPFILRRTKDKVAKELPPKTEMVRTVEITGAQRDLYETVRLAMDKKVRTEIAKKGVARSQIIILEALLKLRQVCCDPRLVKTTGVKKIGAPSAKLVELLEMLDSLLEDGRRILLFSQFTSMLALIELELVARKIPYVLLTGDTQNRAEVVRTFQNGKVPLFLISLKAGGVGLNLTAADTVIHYDPWWNPAVENQATDRAWRIGQDKPVFVYKLIAKGTLEEKIQALQQKKSELAQAILDGGEASKVKLTQEDLQAIFAPLEA